MAGTKAKATLTERGKAAALALREQKRAVAAQNDGEIVEIPWYYRYMDSHYEEMCAVAREAQANA